MQSSSDFSEETQERNAKHAGSMASGEVAMIDGNSVVEELAAPESYPELQQASDVPGTTPIGWRGWIAALRSVLPIYLATHLLLLILTYCSALFAFKNFSTSSLPLSNLLTSWYRWDTGQFIAIADHGYSDAWRTAFFPVFPYMERLLAFLTHDPFVAGLIISNVAGLLMLAALYRLVLEDFDRAQAWNTVVYLSVFPTAFFFAAAYNESLFLLFTLLSFYYMRRSSWWLAALFGLLASLTRSVGICLLLPFCYEYLRQHNFSFRKLRFDVLACAAIPAGTGIFASYCYYRFHDLLAFSHAQAFWSRSLHAPWSSLIEAARLIVHHDLISFNSIHSMIDLSACLFMLALVVLVFVGPWKFPRTYLVYGIYAVVIYVFSLMFPINSSVPLGAFSRYMLEVFPAFIVLAAIGKKQWVNLYYLMFSVSLLAFLLLQFLTDHWVI